MFLLGGEPGVAERAATALHALSPGLVIAGTLAPPLGFDDDPAQLQALASHLRALGPAFVVCALGCPKQERLMAYLHTELPSMWFIGAGSALNIISGATPRAPAWMRSVGLEWAHRLRLEPRRLFRRYVLEDLPFAARLLARSARARFGDRTGSRTSVVDGP